MKRFMKSNSLQKKIDHLDESEIKDLRPDISDQVENSSCKFSARVIKVQNVLLMMKNAKITGMGKKDENDLIGLLDTVEEHVQANREAFVLFQEKLNELVDAGCHVSSWAKSCIKNANDSTADLARNFPCEREEILGRFYDSLPENVRLGNSPVFGGEGSKDIGSYISSVVS